MLYGHHNTSPEKRKEQIVQIQKQISYCSSWSGTHVKYQCLTLTTHFINKQNQTIKTCKPLAGTQKQLQIHLDSRQQLKKNYSNRFDAHSIEHQLLKCRLQNQWQHPDTCDRTICLILSNKNSKVVSSTNFLIWFAMGGGPQPQFMMCMHSIGKYQGKWVLFGHFSWSDTYIWLVCP
jgi:hypothetical protein